jgi:hypothetical protein
MGGAGIVKAIDQRVKIVVVDVFRGKPYTDKFLAEIVVVDRDIGILHQKVCTISKIVVADLGMVASARDPAVKKQVVPDFIVPVSRVRIAVDKIPVYPVVLKQKGFVEGQ